MNLKNTLKTLKLNESTVSMILGALVIIVIGWLTVSYFKTDDDVALPTSTATEESVTSLPTTHKVVAGESLWTISEKYYGTGYNWVDIKEANNLKSGEISEGDELTIPDVEAKNSDVLSTIAPTQTPEITSSPRPEDDQPTAETKQELVAENNTQTEIKANVENKIEGDSYTVVHGDTLWDISVRAYGTGYRWMEIAAANHLDNPNLIHAGNHFVIPR